MAHDSIKHEIPVENKVNKTKVAAPKDTPEMRAEKVRRIRKEKEERDVLAKKSGAKYVESYLAAGMTPAEIKSGLEDQMTDLELEMAEAEDNSSELTAATQKFAEHQYALQHLEKLSKEPLPAISEADLTPLEKTTPVLVEEYEEFPTIDEKDLIPIEQPVPDQVLGKMTGETTFKRAKAKGAEPTKIAKAPVVETPAVEQKKASGSWFGGLMSRAKSAFDSVFVPDKQNPYLAEKKRQEERSGFAKGIDIVEKNRLSALRAGREKENVIRFVMPQEAKTFLKDKERQDEFIERLNNDKQFRRYQRDLKEPNISRSAVTATEGKIDNLKRQLVKEMMLDALTDKIFTDRDRNEKDRQAPGAAAK